MPFGRDGVSPHVGHIGLFVDVGRVARVVCSAVRSDRVRAGSCSLCSVRFLSDISASIGINAMLAC